MICGIESLKNWVTNNNILFWRVLSADGKHTVYNSPSNEGQTLNDSLNALEACFRMLGTGRYNVDGCDKPLSSPSTTKTRLHIAYDHIGAMQGTANMAGIGSPGLDVNTEVARQMESFKRDFELTATKKELDELKVKLAEKEKEIKELEKSSPTDRVLGKLEPAINMWLTGSQSKKAAITGTISADDYTARMEKAFDDWNEADELTKLQLLEKLSKLSNSDPGTYSMGKTLLLSK